MEMNFGRMIHQSNKTYGKVKIGMTGFPGFVSSVHAGGSRAVSKLNTSIGTINALIEKRLTVKSDETNKMFYIEHQLHSGSVLAGFGCITGSNTLVINTLLPLTEISARALASDIAFAIVLGANAETAEYFKSLVALYKEKGADYLFDPNCIQLFILSDAFYFEGKTLINNIIVTTATEEQMCKIKQSFRTGEMTDSQVINAFKNRPMTELKIELAPVKYAEKKASSKNYKSEYEIKFAWDEEAKKQIPSTAIFDSFVPTEEFDNALSLAYHELNIVKSRLDAGVSSDDAIEDNYVNMIFVGSPGGGKTTIAKAIAAALHIPLWTVTNSHFTEEDAYQGMTKVKKGGFDFVATPFLQGFKEGGVILLEEFNLTDPGVIMGALGQAIEKPFLLYEDGYKPVKRHPICVIIGTMNTGTQGSAEPSEAFTSRLPDVFIINDPPKETFIEILKKRSGDAKNAQKVYEAYTYIQSFLRSSTINAPEIAMSLSMRHCFAALRRLGMGMSLKNAIQTTMIGTIALKDLELAKTVSVEVKDLLS